MFKWIPYAFVRIVFFFITGILCGINFPHVVDIKIATGVLIVLCGIYILISCLQKRLAVAGPVAFATIVLAGFVNVQWQNGEWDKSNLANNSAAFTWYKAVITQPPKEAATRWKCELTVQAIKTSNGWVTRRGKLIAYISKDDIESLPRYGDVLLIKGVPSEVSRPANPGEFDYRQFLAYKQIHFQHFTKAHSVRLITHDPPDWFLHHAFSARVWADGILKKYVPGHREHALASALVLGVTDGLDNELMNAYSASGAMHVLSVSGLHVGIVYWLLTLMLMPLQRYGWGKWAMLLISLTILWSYAFITGVSPSVLRAVAMFSFAVIAKTWNHRSNIYNILAASAFCLLLYDPFMIMSVGFQLSYIAVVGIVAIQPGLYALWEPQHRIWDEIWKVAAVSIAAQLATMSISLYYFHQFPNYFLLTNLFVIPGSFIVLLMGIALITLNFITAVAGWLGYALHWLIRLLNAMVFGVEQLPFSVWDNIHINAFQCWIGIVLVIVMLLWITFKRFEWIIVATVCCFAFSASAWLHYASVAGQAKLTVYSIPRTSAMDLSFRGKTQFIGDSTLSRDSQNARFRMLPNRLLSGSTAMITDTSNVKTMHGCTLISWKNKRILRVRDKTFQLPHDLSVDVLILSNNAVLHLDNIANRVKAGEYVVDSSNSYTRSASLMREAEEMNVTLFSVLHQGAYELIL